MALVIRERISVNFPFTCDVESLRSELFSSELFVTVGSFGCWLFNLYGILQIIYRTG